RVVAAFGGDGRRFAGAGDGVLWLREGAGGFDRATEDDGHAGADAAEHAAVVVGLGGNFSRIRGFAALSPRRGAEDVVVFRAAHGGAAEANAVLHAEHGGQ